ncbi:hypothetical protein [Hymenobacter arizonensis]|uniref:Uncharacterized protein n=1 Tax=Hymenobacter arizonensis TaxID=1227077 RepID=A0A1I5ZNT0_HYMAR|nr:hypothetical protein [Hymenobacter arizonensis]SFQ58139.1 hypothetical protein SAMN04515668_3076 [Hymenobacter arizonensis]
MRNALAYLLPLALLVSVQAAQAQATPAPKPKTTPTAPARPASGTTRPRPSYVPPRAVIKDTAAFNRRFRRSASPAADKVPSTPQPRKIN